jgi:hypothetical protein
VPKARCRSAQGAGRESGRNPGLEEGHNGALQGRGGHFQSFQKPVPPLQGSFRALLFLGLAPQALLHRAFSAYALEF